MATKTHHIQEQFSSLVLKLGTFNHVSILKQLLDMGG